MVGDGQQRVAARVARLDGAGAGGAGGQLGQGGEDVGELDHGALLKPP